MSSKRSQITHFFVEPDQIDNNRCLFSREEADHILKTLRLASGDLIKVTDGAGNLYDVILADLDRNGLRGEIVKVSRWLNEVAPEITLAFGLTQQSKADEIIEQGAQLGIREFIPLFAAASIVRLDEAKIRTRIERWRKVAISAVKQSLRCYLPTIAAPQEVSALIRRFGDYDFVGLGSFRGERLTSADNLSAARKILLITGPETGFTPEEEDNMIRAGARPLLLGERRLRAELAPIVLTSAVLVHCGVL